MLAGLRGGEPILRECMCSGFGLWGHTCMMESASGYDTKLSRVQGLEREGTHPRGVCGSSMSLYSAFGSGGIHDTPYQLASMGQSLDHVKGQPSPALKALLPAPGVKAAHSDM